MGVPGLWNVIRPAGQARSLTHIAVEDGFVANTHGHRAFRIGIDASIWFFHAQSSGRRGENPELRTLFFRCTKLLSMPFLPIFVFDGPERPKTKRGKSVSGKAHWLTNSLRTILDAFGFECRTAPGEAEAELSFLNRAGIIDAILSDDIDCFLFGAQTVLRNTSLTLSGNRHNSDSYHTYLYRAQDIARHPAVGLTQGGLVLIALLCGGDYDTNGIQGCGIHTAQALARAGYGDSLLAAAHAGSAALAAFLPVWRLSLRNELRTNVSGCAPRKCPAVAQRITEDFPSRHVLQCYTHPTSSEDIAKESDLDAIGLSSLWGKHPDVGKLAHICERFFEWGTEETILKRFRSLIWPGIVLRMLRYKALEQDAHCENPSSKANAVPLSSALDANILVTSICRSREHASTDNLLEYRLEISPRLLILRVREGLLGLRTISSDSAPIPGLNVDHIEDPKAAMNPDATELVWMPASVVKHALPQLATAFEVHKMKKVGPATSPRPNTSSSPGSVIDLLNEDPLHVSPRLSSKQVDVFMPPPTRHPPDKHRKSTTRPQSSSDEVIIISSDSDDVLIISSDSEDI